MNCSQVLELLSVYYDDELADDMFSNVDDHLSDCSECAQQLATFEQFSVMASDLDTPPPPEHIWGQLERRLDDKTPVALSVASARSWPFFSRRLIAIAATLLVAVGLGWYFAQQLPHGNNEHRQFAVDFEKYLDEFRHDSDAAQGILFAKFDNHPIGLHQTIQTVGYRSAVAEGLPTGYTLASTHVMKMPCSTCLHSVCKRSDGSTLVIFEHDDASCREELCCIIAPNHSIATSWKRGPRHITLVGARDVDEASQMLAWLDKTNQSVPN